MVFRKRLLEELRTQERIEGMMDSGKKGEIKLEEENIVEEAKMNTIKKINQGSIVSNQYQTPTKEKNMADLSIHFNKGKTDSTLNLCKKNNIK